MEHGMSHMGASVITPSFAVSPAPSPQESVHQDMSVFSTENIPRT